MLPSFFLELGHCQSQLKKEENRKWNETRVYSIQTYKQPELPAKIYIQILVLQVINFSFFQDLYHRISRVFMNFPWCWQPCSTLRITFKEFGWSSQALKFCYEIKVLIFDISYISFYVKKQKFFSSRERNDNDLVPSLKIIDFYCSIVADNIIERPLSNQK